LFFVTTLQVKFAGPDFLVNAFWIYCSRIAGKQFVIGRRFFPLEERRWTKAGKFVYRYGRVSRLGGKLLIFRHDALHHTTMLDSWAGALVSRNMQGAENH
jgi:hypothetical protein